MIFHYLAQLISHYAQFPISPIRTRQRVEKLKSKSTQPNYPSRLEVGGGCEEEIVKFVVPPTTRLQLRLPLLEIVYHGLQEVCVLRRPIRRPQPLVLVLQAQQALLHREWTNLEL